MEDRKVDKGQRMEDGVMKVVGNGNKRTVSVVYGIHFWITTEAQSVRSGV